MRLVLPLFACLVALAAPAAAQVSIGLEESVEGTLSPDDPRDSRGRHYDAYRFEARAGWTYVIIASTDDYDARLHAGPAAGDDCSPCVTGDEGYARDARLDVRAEASGTYVVRVTSERAGATGHYFMGVHEHLAEDEAAAMATTDTVVPTMTVDADTLASAPDGVEPDAGRADEIAQGQERAGVLDDTDDEEANPDGWYAYAERWFYEGRAGETITVTVRSAAFNAMLEAGIHDGYGTLTPLGTDDDGGGGTDAQVRATLPDYGPVELRVTAKERGQGGAYTVRLVSDLPAHVEPDSVRYVEDILRALDPARGTLDEWDQVVDGRPADVLEFRGRRGATATLTVRSDDFVPTLLVAVSPTGEVLQAAAAGDGGREARLTFTMPYTTNYLVRVTPARAGQSGEYEIMLDGP